MKEYSIPCICNSYLKFSELQKLNKNFYPNETRNSKNICKTDAKNTF